MNLGLHHAYPHLVSCKHSVTWVLTHAHMKLTSCVTTFTQASGPAVTRLIFFQNQQSIMLNSTGAKSFSLPDIGVLVIHLTTQTAAHLYEGFIWAGHFNLAFMHAVRAMKSPILTSPLLVVRLQTTARWSLNVFKRVKCKVTVPFLRTLSFALVTWNSSINKIIQISNTGPCFKRTVLSIMPNDSLHVLLLHVRL